MKGLPLTYNSDLQEDKEGLFDVVDTLGSTLNIFNGMMATMRIKPEKMVEALDKGYVLATDMADYLVRKGAAFRVAHEAVGKLVNWAIEKDKVFSQVSLSEYRHFSPLFEDDVYLITIDRSLSARNSPGGTAPEQVRQALKEARKILRAEKVKK